MTGILAIETSTDACSLALLIDGELRKQHELVPRRHNQRLFEMLDELLGGANLREAGITHIAYGSGPGSFTGLRVAASAAQGLAFASELPAVAVSSLAVVAQSGLADGVVDDTMQVLATIDARVNELYCALYGFEGGLAVLRSGPWVGAPEELPADATGACAILGSGCVYLDSLPQLVRQQVAACAHEHIVPHAAQLIPLAEAAIARNELQNPFQIAPVYVQDKMSWKKLPEQGRGG